MAGTSLKLSRETSNTITSLQVPSEDAWLLVYMPALKNRSKSAAASAPEVLSEAGSPLNHVSKPLKDDMVIMIIMAYGNFLYISKDYDEINLHADFATHTCGRHPVATCP